MWGSLIPAWCFWPSLLLCRLIVFRGAPYGNDECCLLFKMSFSSSLEERQKVRAIWKAFATEKSRPPRSCIFFVHLRDFNCRGWHSTSDFASVYALCEFFKNIYISDNPFVLLPSFKNRCLWCLLFIWSKLAGDFDDDTISKRQRAERWLGD